MTTASVPSRLSAFLRYLGIAIGLYVAAVVLYGVVIFIGTLLPGPEPSAVSSTNNPGLSQALANWQQLKIDSPADAQALDDAQLLLLEATAEKFRNTAFIDTATTGIAPFEQVVPGALEDLVNGEISQAFPHIWSYLLAGSFPVFGYALGDLPIVAYYNPYFDLALVTQWRLSDAEGTGTPAGYTLTQAWPITGRAFVEDRDPLESDIPLGRAPDTLFEVQIVNSAQIFVVDFEERVPPFERVSSPLSIAPEAKQQAISIAENRIFYLLQWVSEARDPKAPVNYANAIGALESALSATSADALAALLPADNPYTADELFTLLPADVRESMLPYLVIDENVIFIDPNLPTAFLSTYFKPGGQGYTLALALPFDLHTIYPLNTDEATAEQADE